MHSLLASHQSNNVGTFKILGSLPQPPGRQQLAAPERIGPIYAHDVQIAFYLSVLKTIVEHKCRDSKLSFGPFAGRGPVGISDNHRLAEQFPCQLKRLIAGRVNLR